MEGDERETPRTQERKKHRREKDKEERRGKKGERDRENYPTQITQRKGARRGSEIPGCTCKEKQKPKRHSPTRKKTEIQRANSRQMILELSYLGLW